MKYFTLFVLLCVVVAAVTAEREPKEKVGAVGMANPMGSEKEGAEVGDNKKGKRSPARGPQNEAAKEAREKKRSDRKERRKQKKENGSGNPESAAPDTAPAASAVKAPAPVAA